jgi:prepilin-type N-terminal cleavage/methylation domain-containing protein
MKESRRQESGARSPRQYIGSLPPAREFPLPGGEGQGEGERYSSRVGAFNLQPATCNLQLRSAFTLIELLVVIAIIGILAAIAIPTLHAFKPNISQVAARQLLDDIAHARQLAISQRTTIYMVFCPSNYWTAPGYSGLTQLEKDKADKLLDKQLVGYALISLRDVGDQPGRPTPRYWSSWKTLPQGVYIPLQKFTPGTFLDIYTNNNTQLAFHVVPFNTATNIPFPSEEARVFPFVSVPYLAFNYLGQLLGTNGVTPAVEDYIPIAQGAVSVARDPNTKLPIVGPPTMTENPIGNITNTYHLVKIDGITGRGHAIKQEVQ